MFQLDFRDQRPLYEQIKDRIKELIIDGVFKTDEKIPSVRELAANLAINPNTIQKAYKDLESEGYIYSQKAKGSFVAPRKKEESNERVLSLFEELNHIVRELKFLGTEEKCLNTEISKIYKEESL